MASHHHHCHPPTATASTTSYCCANYASYHHPPPPEPHLLHHPPPPQALFYSPYPNPPYTIQSLHHQYHHHQQQPQYYPPPTGFDKEGYFQELRQRSHTQPTVSSLLRRIAALESSFRHHSSPHSHSLRDTAARTIQTYFRAFLVRRSRTLRQLKDLASIKSNLNVLKLSESDHRHLDHQALLKTARNLQLKLESVQGDDPMIRDAKKAISRELSCFIDLIDGVTVKKSPRRLVKKNTRHGESTKKESRNLFNDSKVGNVHNHDLGQDKMLEDLVKRVDALYNRVPEVDEGEDEDLENPSISMMIGMDGVPQTRNGSLRKRRDGLDSKVKKCVTFAETGNVYMFPRSRHQPVLIRDFDCDDGSDSIGAKSKHGGECCREAEEVGEFSFKDTEDDEEAQSEDAVSPKSSDDGERGRTLSAPLPAKMETRSDLMDKRKTLKMVE